MKLLVCNTGMTTKSHLRRDTDYATLCGKGVSVANRGDEDLPLDAAKCRKCQSIRQGWAHLQEIRK